MIHPDWITPQWPAPPSVRAVCTTRAGGRSVPPYDSLNLGDHVGDDALAVGANRAVLAQALGAHPVFLKQVHGHGVVTLDAHTPHGTEADACRTRERGLACTIMVADCLPLLFTDAQGSFVAAAHAGWRGLAGQGSVGVLESLHAALGRPARELLVWLGPCIGPQAFEVGDEVRAAFLAQDARAALCFTALATPGKWLADLQALARQRLTRLGIHQIYGNDGTPSWCTVTQTSRFFSHRRDRVSGRLAACIWRV
jgi:YfiH family protein